MGCIGQRSPPLRKGKTMPIARFLYWFLVGGMIVFGTIGLLSIGLPFILLGAILLTFGALRFGWRKA